VVADGRITLIGSDRFEEGGSYAWGIAVLLEAASDLKDAYLSAYRQNLGNILEGCMLKSPLDGAWCRVGTSAAARGLVPTDLATAYLAKIKGVEGVDKVEVVMELAAPHELGEFASLLQNERERYLKAMGQDMSARGVDIQCVPGAHCGSCSDKKACAEVRKMQRTHAAAVAAEA
jgi:CO dehydrogenase/acetyl-CoA synthase beta subunit